MKNRRRNAVMSKTKNSTVEPRLRRAQREGGSRGLPSTSFTVGEKVEARCNDIDPRFYPGSIVAVNGNDVYDIAFDDGDKGMDTPRLRIRRPGEKEKKELVVGQKVEARYKGGKKLFGGKVAVVDRGGDYCYSIQYDDGDVETAVKRELIIAQSGTVALKPIEPIKESASTYEKTDNVIQNPPVATTKTVDVSSQEIKSNEGEDLADVPTPNRRQPDTMNQTSLSSTLIISDQHLAELKTTIAKADKDERGSMSKNELTNLVHSVLGPREPVLALIDRMPADEEGNSISVAEFIAKVAVFATDQQPASPQQQRSVESEDTKLAVAAVTTSHVMMGPWGIDSTQLSVSTWLSTTGLEELRSWALALVACNGTLVEHGRCGLLSEGPNDFGIQRLGSSDQPVPLGEIQKKLPTLLPSWGPVNTSLLVAIAAWCKPDQLGQTSSSDHPTLISTSPKSGDTSNSFPAPFSADSLVSLTLLQRFVAAQAEAARLVAAELAAAIGQEMSADAARKIRALRQQHPTNSGAEGASADSGFSQSAALAGLTSNTHPSVALVLAQIVDSSKGNKAASVNDGAEDNEWTLADWVEALRALGERREEAVAAKPFAQVGERVEMLLSSQSSSSGDDGNKGWCSGIVAGRHGDRYDVHLTQSSGASLQSCVGADVLRKRRRGGNGSSDGTDSGGRNKGFLAYGCEGISNVHPSLTTGSSPILGPSYGCATTEEEEGVGAFSDSEDEDENMPRTAVDTMPRVANSRQRGQAHEVAGGVLTGAASKSDDWAPPLPVSGNKAQGDWWWSTGRRSDSSSRSSSSSSSSSKGSAHSQSISSNHENQSGASTGIGGCGCGGENSGGFGGGGSISGGVGVSGVRSRGGASRVSCVVRLLERRVKNARQKASDEHERQEDPMGDNKTDNDEATPSFAMVRQKRRQRRLAEALLTAPPTTVELLASLVDAYNPRPPSRAASSKTETFGKSSDITSLASLGRSLSLHGATSLFDQSSDNADGSKCGSGSGRGDNGEGGQQHDRSRARDNNNNNNSADDNDGDASRYFPWSRPVFSEACRRALYGVGWCRPAVLVRRFRRVGMALRPRVAGAMADRCSGHALGPGSDAATASLAKRLGDVTANTKGGAAAGATAKATSAGASTAANGGGADVADSDAAPLGVKLVMDKVTVEIGCGAALVDCDWLLRLLIGSADVGGFPLAVEPVPFLIGTFPTTASSPTASPAHSTAAAAGVNRGGDAHQDNNFCWNNLLDLMADKPLVVLRPCGSATLTQLEAIAQRAVAWILQDALWRQEEDDVDDEEEDGEEEDEGKEDDIGAFRSAVGSTKVEKGHNNSNKKKRKKFEQRKEQRHAPLQVHLLLPKLSFLTPARQPTQFTLSDQFNHRNSGFVTKGGSGGGSGGGVSSSRDTRFISPSSSVAAHLCGLASVAPFLGRAVQEKWPGFMHPNLLTAANAHVAVPTRNGTQLVCRVGNNARGSCNNSSSSTQVGVRTGIEIPLNAFAGRVKQRIKQRSIARAVAAAASAAAKTSARQSNNNNSTGSQQPFFAFNEDVEAEEAAAEHQRNLLFPVRRAPPPLFANTNSSSGEKASGLWRVADVFVKGEALVCGSMQTVKQLQHPLRQEDEQLKRRSHHEEEHQKLSEKQRQQRQQQLQEQRQQQNKQQEEEEQQPGKKPQKQKQKHGLEKENLCEEEEEENPFVARAELGHITASDRLKQALLHSSRNKSADGSNDISNVSSSSAKADDVFTWGPKDVARFVAAAGLDSDLTVVTVVGPHQYVGVTSSSDSSSSPQALPGDEQRRRWRRRRVSDLFVAKKCGGLSFVLMNETDLFQVVGVANKSKRQKLCVWSKSLLLKSLRRSYLARLSGQQAEKWDVKACAAWFAFDLKWLGVARAVLRHSISGEALLSSNLFDETAALVLAKCSLGFRALVGHNDNEKLEAEEDEIWGPHVVTARKRMVQMDEMTTLAETEEETLVRRGELTSRGGGTRGTKEGKRGNSKEKSRKSASPSSPSSPFSPSSLSTVAAAAPCFPWLSCPHDSSLSNHSQAATAQQLLLKSSARSFLKPLRTLLRPSAGTSGAQATPGVEAAETQHEEGGPLFEQPVAVPTKGRRGGHRIVSQDKEMPRLFAHRFEDDWSMMPSSSSSSSVPSSLADVVVEVAAAVLAAVSLLRNPKLCGVVAAPLTDRPTIRAITAATASTAAATSSSLQKKKKHSQSSSSTHSNPFAEILSNTFHPSVKQQTKGSNNINPNQANIGRSETDGWNPLPQKNEKGALVSSKSSSSSSPLQHKDLSKTLELIQRRQATIEKAIRGGEEFQGSGEDHAADEDDDKAFDLEARISQVVEPRPITMHQQGRGGGMGAVKAVLEVEQKRVEEAVHSFGDNIDSGYIQGANAAAAARNDDLEEADAKMHALFKGSSLEQLLLEKPQPLHLKNNSPVGDTEELVTLVPTSVVKKSGETGRDGGQRDDNKNDDDDRAYMIEVRQLLSRHATWIEKARNFNSFGCFGGDDGGGSVGSASGISASTAMKATTAASSIFFLGDGKRHQDQQQTQVQQKQQQQEKQEQRQLYEQLAKTAAMNKPPLHKLARHYSRGDYYNYDCDDCASDGHRQEGEKGLKQTTGQLQGQVNNKQGAVKQNGASDKLEHVDNSDDADSADDDDDDDDDQEANVRPPWRAPSTITKSQPIPRGKGGKGSQSFELFESVAEVARRTREEEEKKRLEEEESSSSSDDDNDNGGSGSGDMIPCTPSELASQWAMFDNNGNGLVSVGEVQIFIKNRYPKFSTPNYKQAVLKAFQLADADGSGLVTKGEFFTLLKSLNHFKRLLSAFKKVDKDRSGVLNLEEFCMGQAHLDTILSGRNNNNNNNNNNNSGGGGVGDGRGVGGGKEDDGHKKIEVNDINGDEEGNKQEEEEKGAAAKRVRELRVESEELFQRIDTDGSGTLRFSELAAHSARLLVKMEEKMVQERVKQQQRNYIDDDYSNQSSHRHGSNHDQADGEGKDHHNNAAQLLSKSNQLSDIKETGESTAAAEEGNSRAHRSSSLKLSIAERGKVREKELEAKEAELALIKKRRLRKQRRRRASRQQHPQLVTVDAWERSSTELLKAAAKVAVLCFGKRVAEEVVGNRKQQQQRWRQGQQQALGHERYQRGVALSSGVDENHQDCGGGSSSSSSSSNAAAATVPLRLQQQQSLAPALSPMLNALAACADVAYCLKLDNNSGDETALQTKLNSKVSSGSSVVVAAAATANVKVAAEAEAVSSFSYREFRINAMLAFAVFPRDQAPKPTHFLTPPPNKQSAAAPLTSPHTKTKATSTSFSVTAVSIPAAGKEAAVMGKSKPLSNSTNGRGGGGNGTSGGGGGKGESHRHRLKTAAAAAAEASAVAATVTCARKLAMAPLTQGEVQRGLQGMGLRLSKVQWHLLWAALVVVGGDDTKKHQEEEEREGGGGGGIAEDTTTRSSNNNAMDSFHRTYGGGGGGGDGVSTGGGGSNTKSVNSRRRSEGGIGCGGGDSGGTADFTNRSTPLRCSPEMWERNLAAGLGLQSPPTSLPSPQVPLTAVKEGQNGKVGEGEGAEIAPGEINFARSSLTLERRTRKKDALSLTLATNTTNTAPTTAAAATLGARTLHFEEKGMVGHPQQLQPSSPSLIPTTTAADNTALLATAISELSQAVAKRQKEVKAIVTALKEGEREELEEQGRKAEKGAAVARELAGRALANVVAETVRRRRKERQQQQQTGSTAPAAVAPAAPTAGLLFDNGTAVAALVGAHQRASRKLAALEKLIGAFAKCLHATPPPQQLTPPLKTVITEGATVAATAISLLSFDQSVTTLTLQDLKELRWTIKEAVKLIDGGVEPKEAVTNA